MKNFVSELDCEDAEFDNFAINVNCDGELAEIVILFVEFEVLVEELEHFLLEGAATPAISLGPLA